MASNYPHALAVAMLLLCACSPSRETDAPPLPDPLSFTVEKDGPFLAGYRTLETSYASPADAGTRKLVLHLWYPSEQTGELNPTYSLLFTDDDVFVETPLARTPYADGFPVLVHSHGFRGYGGNSAELMRHFATHGWVVVAPDHAENTLLDAADPLPTAHYFQRPLDIRASLDALDDLASSDPLAGKVDLERVLMSGHSFGTYTSWACAGAHFNLESLQAGCDAGELPEGSCSADEVAVFQSDLSEPRLKAAIPMAGRPRALFFGDDGYNAVKIPILFMSGGDDDVGADELFAMIDPKVDFTWVEVAGGCHQLFGFGDCENITNDIGFPIVNAYALAFARYHVLGDDSSSIADIVSGKTAVSELAHFQHR